MVQRRDRLSHTTAAAGRSNSWPAFMLVPFEVGILAAAIAGFIALLWSVRPAAPASSAVRSRRFRARKPGSLLPARSRAAPNDDERRAIVRRVLRSRGRRRDPRGPSHDARLAHPLRARAAAGRLLRSQHDAADASYGTYAPTPLVARRHVGAAAAGRTSWRKAISNAPAGGKDAAAGQRRACWRAASERFGIYCAPCHGLAGDGDGMIVAAAFRRRRPITSDGCSPRRPSISTT